MGSNPLWGTKMDTTANKEHLKQVMLGQRAVRRMEVEGMVMPVEKWLEHAFYLGLITMADEDELLEILKGKNDETWPRSTMDG